MFRVLGFANGVRAHHIWELFKGLQIEIQTPKERLQLLLRLKNFAGCLNCPLAADLVALIEREADLRSRWVPCGCRDIRSCFEKWLMSLPKYSLTAKIALRAGWQDCAPRVLGCEAHLG